MESIETLSRGRTGFAKWQEDLRAICGRFEAVAPPDLGEEFLGRIALHRMQGLEFADITTNAHALTKSPADVRAEDGHHYFLIYQQSGRSLLCQHGRQALLHPGDCTLIDSRYGSEFYYLDGTRHLSFHLPCENLERRLKTRPRICEVLPGSGPIGAVLGRFLLEIAARHSLFGEREGAAMAEALLAMLAPVGDDCDRPIGGRRDYARVLALIEARLGENLSVEVIARAAGLSVRSLFRLFEERDTSPAAYIRKRRLERCAQELRAPQHHHESLTEIAFRWGFNDSAHFSRSFRAHYDMTPMEYRRLRPGPAALRPRGSPQQVAGSGRQDSRPPRR